ncbi:MAG: ABC transporter substrate-binding protein [Bacteroidota bacterium]|nr:ABC transporter substrate-binding protein [Bacteroidota bacterium]
MKKNILFLFTFFVLFGLPNSYAQNNIVHSEKVYRVAIFAPMYLDSIFENGQLISQRTLPKSSMPAVEFVQGAQIAFDTLQLNGKRIEAFIYDSKSFTKSIFWLIRNKQLDSIDLIIGSVKEPDYSELAQFAVQRSIPFISATYPNDAGIKENPFTVIVNSTLKAHCEGIFSYIMQKHGTDNIYLIKKKGDNRIDDYFKSINTADGKQLLKIKTIILDSSISSYGLRNLIDTTKPIVIIGASLDETFAKKLADACYPIQKKNPLVLVGMPNWDGFKSLVKKSAFKDFPIRYTTPHYDTKDNPFSTFFSQRYFQLYRAKQPSDMAFKGFELTYYFTRMLLDYGNNFMQHLNENNLVVFHDFNFKPVFSNKNNKVPDYYENKHLFIMEILNGEIEREW